MGSIFQGYTEFILDKQAVILTLVILFTAGAGFFFMQNSLRLNKLRSLYRSALAREDLGLLEDVLQNQSEVEQRLEARVSSLERSMARLESAGSRHLQHCVLERYRAFKDVGGDQSFSLALLDAHRDGVILTSIYGRDEARIFAKKIRAGVSVHPLSEEEKRVLAATEEESDAWEQEIPEVVTK